jgi:two-component system, cell cycle sensor histidine kinase and response regulator CckA
MQSLTDRKTILIAEDDHSIRGLLGLMLRIGGYMVLEAVDGSQALAVCEQHRGSIDLLLTDVAMPGLNGRQLAERAADLRPEMKTVVVSGDVGAAGMEPWGNAAHGFIQKPFSQEQLNLKIREVIEGAVA